MRLILYIAALALFALAHFPALQNLEKQEKLFDLAILAFLAIAIDVVYRLRKSVYIFYPLVWGAGLLYRYLELPYHQYAYAADYLVHIPLGVMLIMQSRTQKADDAGVRGVLLWLGVLSLVFSLRLLDVYVQSEPLQTFFRLHIESYIILAVAGKALLQNQFQHAFTAERQVAVLLIVLNAVLVIQWLLTLMFDTGDAA